MSENTQYQLNFLWAAYFGIKKDEAEGDEDKAIRACCRRAYRDLSRTLKYTYSSSELDSWTKEKKKDEDAYKEGKENKDTYTEKMKKYKNDVEEKLTELCKNIPTEEGAFKEWHFAACKYIIDKSNVACDLITGGNKEHVALFKAAPTIGQAQKWVNMTLKYMLVMGIERMEALKPVLHVPVDSYIIEKAQDELDVQSPFPNWSKINDYGKYLNYQDDIKKNAAEKKNKTAIDWEGDAWIDIATTSQEN